MGETDLLKFCPFCGIIRGLNTSANLPPLRSFRKTAEKDAKWDTYKLAIGTTEGQAKISVTSGHVGTSSLLDLTDYYLEHVATFSKATRTENVALKR